MEETGLQVNEVNEVLSSFATPGAHMEKTIFFIAAYSEEDRINEGGGLDEEHEDIEVLEYDYKEVIDLYKSKKIHDAKTIIMIQYAIIEGIIS